MSASPETQPLTERDEAQVWVGGHWHRPDQRRAASGQSDTTQIWETPMSTHRNKCWVSEADLYMAERRVVGGLIWWN